MSSDYSFAVAEIQAYALACHRSLDMLRTAYTVANETRRLLQCDRVVVLLDRRGALRAEAVSDQVSVNRQSEVIDKLEHLAEQSRIHRRWFASSGVNETESVPNLASALQAYLDVAEVRTVAIAPLTEPAGEGEHPVAGDPRVFGCIVAESFGEADGDETIRRLESLSVHAAAALHNAQTHHSVFLLPLWESIGRWRGVVATRHRPKTAIVLLLLICLAATGFISMPFRIAADGFAEPTIRRRVFASEDGVIDELSVRHGDRVAHDQPLAKLRSADLDLKLEEVAGEIATAEKRLEAIKSLQVGGGGSTGSTGRTDQDRFAAEAEELKLNVDALEKQRKLLLKRREALTLRSPIGGQVITWDVETALTARPVARGQSLLTVAEVDGAWQVEARLPEARYQHFTAAREAQGDRLQVELAAKSDPTRRICGMTRIAASAMRESERDGRYLPLTVEFVDPRPDDWRPGTAVEVRIDCGRRSVAFVWFHELVEFVQARILF